MNPKPDLDVLRVELVGGGSVVVKVTVGEETRERRDSFGAELANLTFLTELGFERVPRLLGHADGVLVLEDIRGQSELADRTAAEQALAATLAALHVRTDGHHSAWLSLHSGVPPRFHAELWESDYLRGHEYLVGMAASLDQSWPSQLAEQGFTLATSPDRRTSLVHNDLASGRQCAIRDGEVWLLDFERADFGCGWMDAARVLVGEMAVWFEDRTASYRHLDFGTEFLNTYERHLMAAGHQSARGRACLAACAAAIAASLIGSCLRGAAELRFDPSLPHNVAAILERTAEVVEMARPGDAEAQELRGLASLLSPAAS